MMKGCPPIFAAAGAHSLDVRGAFNERLAHRVNAFFKRKLKARAVVFGKRADAQIDAWQVQSLA
jgi:hypothetical protein